MPARRPRAIPSSFPPDFLWGTATSAYQIEGAVREDGRGESIWDRFSHTPGKTLNGDTGDVACDHYHRWAEDLDLVAALGVRSYRFSVAWPRVMPTGRGPVNQRGLDFYRRLVDGLVARGVAPAVTLYHWDLPQALQDHGGWADRDTVGRFADYAEAVYRGLGESVPMWITHNEPWCSGFLGYHKGIHAPGILDLPTALRAIHHILLSHGQAVAAFRALGQRGRIGITLNLWPTYPETDAEADAAAARASDGYTNRWFLDAVLRGGYPADMRELYTRWAGPLDFESDGDAQATAAAIDFLGINYYQRRVVRAEAGLPGWRVREAALPGEPAAGTDRWELTPSGLTDLLVRVRDDYGQLPLYVTENGVPVDDIVGPDGAVHDLERIDYLREHLRAALAAIDAGVDLRGYYAWSLLDNFEWSLGYTRRYGLVYVDYATQARISKSSFAAFREIALTGRLDP